MRVAKATLRSGTLAGLGNTSSASVVDTVATAQLLGQLERRHVLQAIDLLDGGVETRFAESTKFDVLANATRYPPKRVCGLALQLQTGLPFGPKSFKGGEESACFKALRSCGFTIVPKSAPSDSELVPLLREVLNLQKEYSSSNTPAMQRRGEVIRRAIPAYLTERLDRLEPRFTAGSFSVEVEGSDGVGRKNESPWVRLYDPAMSPSATNGWYIVLHFSRLGTAMYVTLGCGATTFKAGSLVDIPEDLLRERVDWARQSASSLLPANAQYEDTIELDGNHLSGQFERATAFCKRYPTNQISEPAIWADLEALSVVLIELYEKERLGRAPLSSQPELLSAELDVQAAVAGRRGTSRGQGRGLTAAERRAVELRAMELALDALIKAGFSSIRDRSADSSFDYTAMKNGQLWHIEVKGTTSARAEAFLLTAPELRLHQAPETRSVLILASQIDLDRSTDPVSATGGIVELLAPWDLDAWDFKPTAYQATRRLEQLRIQPCRCSLLDGRRQQTIKGLQAHQG